LGEKPKLVLSFSKTQPNFEGNVLNIVQTKRETKRETKFFAIISKVQFNLSKYCLNHPTG